MGFTFRQLISRLITSAAERLFSKWIFGGEAKSFGGRYEILRIISQPRTLSAAYQQFIHFNLPINFHHETFDSKFLWLFCTFRSRIWNQLFIVTTTGLYQMSSFFSLLSNKDDKTLKLAFRFFSFFFNRWVMTAHICMSIATAMPRPLFRTYIFSSVQIVYKVDIRDINSTGTCYIVLFSEITLL